MPLMNTIIQNFKEKISLLEKAKYFWEYIKQLW